MFRKELKSPRMAPERGIEEPPSQENSLIQESLAIILQQFEIHQDQTNNGFKMIHNQFKELSNRIDLSNKIDKLETENWEVVKKGGKDRNKTRGKGGKYTETGDRKGETI